MIESSNNQQIKLLMHIQKNSRFRRKENAFVAEGWKMVKEAYGHGLVRKIFISETRLDEAKQKIPQVVAEAEIVEEKLFAKLSDTMAPQGILAIVEMPHYSLQDYLQQEEIRFLCLEDINDPGNLGTMMRTAEGAGMTGVIISKGTVDLFNPKVVRSTMGSLFRVPFFYTENFIEQMKELKEDGVALYAAHLKGSVPYTKANYQKRLGIMIGNEANGLTDEVTALADQKVRIPMEGQLESLNAAVSAAILMYETARASK